MTPKQSDSDRLHWMALENESAIEDPSCQCKECDELRSEAALLRRAGHRAELVPKLDAAIRLLARHLAAYEKHRIHPTVHSLQELNESGEALFANAEAYEAYRIASGIETGGSS